MLTSHDNLQTDWSPTFSAHVHPGSTRVSHVLKLMNEEDGSMTNLVAECVTKARCHTVTIRAGTVVAPLCIRNHSSTPVRFQQTGQPRRYVLLPHEQMDYALDAPSPQASQVGQLCVTTTGLFV